MEFRPSGIVFDTRVIIYISTLLALTDMVVMFCARPQRADGWL